MKALVVVDAGRETLKGCCAACAVPTGAFKAMQVAAGMALPKDVNLSIESETEPVQQQGVNTMTVKINILFLCTGNSCRSQMAEGWARALKSDVIEAWSAGIETHGLNPNAVTVMAEAGVDISGQRSKTVDAVKDIPFDLVVTVCGHAHETCPMWLRGKAKVIHAGFDDPPALARDAKTEEEALAHYRRIRDEIRSFVAALPFPEE